MSSLASNAAHILASTSALALYRPVSIFHKEANATPLCAASSLRLSPRFILSSLSRAQSRAQSSLLVVSFSVISSIVHFCSKKPRGVTHPEFLSKKCRRGHSSALLKKSRLRSHAAAFFMLTANPCASVASCISMRHRGGLLR